MDMESLNFIIPSQQMREYLCKVDHEFTDFEKATLIYRAEERWCKREQELLKLSSLTRDENLKKQIKEQVLYKRKCYDYFIRNDEYKFVYLLVITTNTSFDEVVGYFGSVEMAKKYSQTHGCEREGETDYRIRKELILQDDKTLEEYYCKYGNSIVEDWILQGEN